MKSLLQRVLEVAPSRLTLRQREIARLMAESHLAKGIALDLGLSVKTVYHHRQAICRRLGLTSSERQQKTQEAALITRWAIAHGLTFI